MSSVFEYEHKVKPDEIDGLNHVNNLVYLKWFMDAAEEHSKFCGWPCKKMIEVGQGWVVRRHEIDYLAQVKLNESIIIRTWIDSAGRASCARKYEIIRVSDGKIVCGGNTVWVWLNYKTGRISQIPGDLVKTFEINEYVKS